MEGRCYPAAKSEEATMTARRVLTGLAFCAALTVAGPVMAQTKSPPELYYDAYKDAFTKLNLYADESACDTPSAQGVQADLLVMDQNRKATDAMAPSVAKDMGGTELDVIFNFAEAAVNRKCTAIATAQYNFVPANFTGDDWQAARDRAKTALAKLPAAGK
jgi:hypothetical protein